METNERKHDMHKVDRDILVSATDKSVEEQKEYSDYLDKQARERTEDLDNQELSKGEDNEA
jgi:DNA-binding MarR family transcriptional regulator|tara:strand:- start:294 stop:476 length:183 start_codon:yes stop_codon:yes gene_type:complete